MEYEDLFMMLAIRFHEFKRPLLRELIWKRGPSDGFFLGELQQFFSIELPNQTDLL